MSEQETKRFSLLDAVDQVVAIMGSLDQGEITPEAGERLEQLGLTIEQKVESYHLARCRLMADAEACSREAQRLRARAEARENARRQLEGRLTLALSMLGQRQIKTPTITCYKQPNHSVIVRNLAEIPERYKIREPASERADKRALLEALKLGPVPGAELETTETVRFK